MTDHWGRLENDNRRRIEQQRKDQADYIRRFGGIEVPKTPKQYPDLNDPPPGKVKFAIYAVAFALFLLLAIVLCGATVYVYFERMPHP